MADMTLEAERLDRSEASLTTVDGTPLKKKLALSMRKARMRALLLTAPLVLFIFISFILPIGQMLMRSIHNDGFSGTLPNVSAALREWDQSKSTDGLPDEEIFRLLVEDLVAARKNRRVGYTIGNAANRLNYDFSGTNSLMKKTARKARKMEAPFKEAVLGVDKKWSNPEVWAAAKRVSYSYTSWYYLVSVDRTRNAEGDIVMRDELRQIYVKLFMRTLMLSLTITVICLFLGFPVAYLLSVLPLAKSNLLMILVLLPFWTSLLVRTTAWIALLQTEGIVNDLLVLIGVIGDDGRVQMIYNQTGTVIAMTHILLPFMILPLYSVMKTISPSYMRAARSLGATPLTAFIKVYLPQTLPGIAAGTLLVFILAIGYYITPALVGGNDGIFISNAIADLFGDTRWSLAAALASILFGGVLILYWLYNKLVGIDNLKFG